MSHESGILFSERQRFRQWWLILLLVAFDLFLLYIAIQQLVLHRPVGSNPASDAVLWVILVCSGIGFPVFIATIILHTEVRQDGLYVRFFPLHRRLRKIEGVEHWEACTYRPIRDYGGWGIRYGRKGKAYNISGNRGVQLTLASGKRLLIGSQRAEEFAAALDAALGRQEQHGRGPSGSGSGSHSVPRDPRRASWREQRKGR